MRLSNFAAAAGLFVAAAPGAFADLTTYDQDFEGLDASDPNALAGAGFIAFANVFDPGGGYLYGYSGGGAPNGGAGFSAVNTTLTGAAQGAQCIDIYSDYNNGDHANGNYIDALVFQEQTIAAANVGQTWRFSFDYRRNPNVNNGQGDTTTFAFVKVLRSSDGSFATIVEVPFETTGASDTAWASTMLDLTIDPTYAGELLQFGFRSYATNYNDSSRVYDNIVWEQIGGGPPSLMPYSQDFEGLDIMAPTALSADGYKIFANVYDAMGGLLYGYGVFDAPNGGPGFSAIGTGDGGPDQGAQYLNVYSDYNNGDHGNGLYIEALIFQEQPIGPANVGQTWRLAFDVRRNPNVVNGEGDSTMFAFIKVLRSSDGSFATIAEVERETTGASADAWATSAIDLLIDPSLEGELLQFGFRSVATNFNDTGRFYDNISFSENTNPGIGEVVCLGNRSSNGLGSLLTITGSDVVADNDITLTVTDLPANAMGYFVHSQATNFVYNPGGSDGHLCIASFDMGRFASSVLNSGASGTVSLSPDLNALPGPRGTIAAMAGETRCFQYWTRDNGSAFGTSNFSSASCVTFQ